MKKIILIPDSFKGTMGSSDICAIMKKEVIKYYPNCNVVSIPVADGGEGSVECFLQAVGGSSVNITANNPHFEPMQSFYGIINKGDTAVVEMAAAAGLPLVEGRRNPLVTTTYGVGELIKHASQSGVKKIIVGLGGSATNDVGCGAAAACGVRFYNSKNDSFIPTGGTLIDVSRIDISGLDPALAGIEIVAMCDIDNPMYGSTGAAHIFGPQKGATTPELVATLDRGLVHISKIIERDLGQSVHEIPGSGAAGAMGAGMIAFFGAKLQMGIESVLDTVRFDDELKTADLVITGEGRIDGQSLRGKVVIGVARRSKKANVPVVAVVGDIGENMDGAYDEGVSSIISINRVAVEFPIAKTRSRSDLALTIDNLMRFCHRMGL